MRAYCGRVGGKAARRQQTAGRTSDGGTYGAAGAALWERRYGGTAVTDGRGYGGAVIISLAEASLAEASLAEASLAEASLAEASVAEASVAEASVAEASVAEAALVSSPSLAEKSGPF